MKIKFYKGPFSGRVAESDALPSYGDEVLMRGPKKMSRRERYEWDYQRIGYMGALYNQPYPQVEARYKRMSHPMHPAIPLMHPDGSYFYEYVEGSKREF